MRDRQTDRERERERESKTQVLCHSTSQWSKYWEIQKGQDVLPVSIPISWHGCLCLLLPWFWFLGSGDIDLCPSAQMNSSNVCIVPMVNQCLVKYFYLLPWNLRTLTLGSSFLYISFYAFLPPSVVFFLLSFWFSSLIVCFFSITLFNQNHYPKSKFNYLFCGWTVTYTNASPILWPLEF